MANKRDDEYTEIPARTDLTIRVWDPLANRTKKVTAEGIAALYSASGQVVTYATSAASGSVILATSGDIASGNPSKSVTPNLVALKYNKLNTSPNYTLNQYSGEITDISFNIATESQRIVITNSLAVAGDFYAVQIETADPNTDKISVTSVKSDDGSIIIGVNNSGNPYNGTLRIRFKKL